MGSLSVVSEARVGKLHTRARCVCALCNQDNILKKARRQRLHRPSWREVNGSLDRYSPVSTFPLDSNSNSHLLPVLAARKRVPIGCRFIFLLLAELVSAIPCSP